MRVVISLFTPASRRGARAETTLRRVITRALFFRPSNRAGPAQPRRFSRYFLPSFFLLFIVAGKLNSPFVYTFPRFLCPLLLLLHSDTLFLYISLGRSLAPPSPVTINARRVRRKVENVRRLGWR